MPSALMDVSDIPSILFTNISKHTLKYYFRESDDRVQRSSKFVTHVRQKFGLRPVSALGCLLGYLKIVGQPLRGQQFHLTLLEFQLHSDVTGVLFGVIVIYDAIQVVIRNKMM